MAINGSVTKNNTVRSIRLDERALTQLLAKLETDPRFRCADAASNAPLPYHGKQIVVNFQRKDGSNSSFREPIVVLHADNVAFLHGGFVHQNTKCTGQLITAHGAWQDVAGSIVDCQYIEGNVHCLTFKFSTPIDLELFAHESRKPSVLLVDDNAFVARMSGVYLSQLNTEVEFAPDGHVALEKAQNKTFDLILMDMEMPGMDGFTATAQLRSRGYSGLIVAATALTQDSVRKRCLDAGCDEYISKPYSKDTLARLIASVHEEPLHSTLATDASLAPMINEFVADLARRIKAIQDAMHAQDLQQVMGLVRDLKSEGSMYGFAPLTERAASIETEVHGGAAFGKLRGQLHDLVKLCRSARPVQMAPNEDATVSAM